MKKFVILVIIMILLNVHYIFTQDNSKFDERSLTTEKKIHSYETPVLEDFEDIARANKWVIGNTSVNIFSNFTGLKVSDGGPFGLAVPAEQKKYCLGLRTAFKSMGYNFIELLPPVFDSSLFPKLKVLFQNDIPNPDNERFIPIPGKCAAISIWISGRNYNYSLEVWLKDFWGFVYSIDMGSIDFAGWQNLTTAIPGYVQQTAKYLPKNKPLKFIKFVLHATPNEIPDKFYVYFDQLAVISDLYIERFDGDSNKDSW